MTLIQTGRWANGVNLVVTPQRERERERGGRIAQSVYLPATDVMVGEIM